MLTAAVVIVWVAALYRVVISWSLPATLWRSTFTAVITLDAFALTIYRFRGPIDEQLGVPNVAGLLGRVAVVLGLGCLLTYLHALREDHVPRRAIVLYVLLTVAVTATLVVSWWASPFHTTELDDLLLAGTGMSSAVYLLAFWVFLGLGLAMTAVTCLARRHSLHRTDRVREISLMLSACGSAIGVLVMILWITSLVITMGGGDGGRVNAAGDVLMPASAVVTGIGVMSLLVVPYVTDLLAAAALARRLRPLWLTTISRYPQVHLDAQPPLGGPLSRSRFRLERMIIEILDVLRIAPVAVPAKGTTPYDLIAGSLCTPGRGGPLRASQLLTAETREDELTQLRRLAAAHDRFRHALP